MSEPTIIALIPVFMALIGLGTAIVGYFVIRANAKIAAVAVAMDANTKATEETSKKADTIIEKAIEIRSTTDGHLHQVTADLKVANEQIVGLKNVMAVLAETKK